jgi:hypothetical protein
VLVSANTRYAGPAVVLAAPLLAVAAARLRAGRIVVEAALLGCVVAGLNRYVAAPAPRVVATAGALLAAAATCWLARRTRLVLIVPALVACVAIVTIYHDQRVLADRPWLPDDSTVDYVLAHHPSGTRIGITGTWTAQGLVPVAPLFGPRFGNTVGYVGPIVRHRLEQYRSRPRFLAALRRGRFQLLEIGTGFPPSADPQEVNWAVAGGYTFVTRSARLILLRAPASASAAARTRRRLPSRRASAGTGQAASGPASARGTALRSRTG